MACLALNVNALPQAMLTVTPLVLPTLVAETQVSSRFTVEVSVQSVLTVGEVCSISTGELTVLAASDGPLRTRDGGFFLLDPARETN